MTTLSLSGAAYSLVFLPAGMLKNKTSCRNLKISSDDRGCRPPMIKHVIDYRGDS
jgi:hypothetical protein